MSFLLREKAPMRPMRPPGHTGMDTVNSEINAIHRFWFGTLDEQGLADPAHQRLWFSASAETDDALRERFGHLVEQALAGSLGGWCDGDNGLIALVLLLDQFTRNIYRDTAGAFAGDGRALDLARTAIAAGRHRTLPLIHRVFLYLPLEHSEDLAVQDECLELFAELSRDASPGHVDDFARYARAHRDVIARFGRFPHRNAILGRSSSAAELDYLAQHGGF